MAEAEHDAEIVTFTDTLIQITEKLEKFETKQFKFLCSDEIASGILEEMDATDLIKLLFERRIISAENVDFLTECLILIGRMDIVNELRCEPAHIKDLCNDLKKYNSTHLGRFRILLFHLAANIIKDDIKKIMLYLDGQKVTFPKANIEKNQSGIDLFNNLIKVNFVHPDNVNNLVDLAKTLNREDLVEKIKIYSDGQKESCGKEKRIMEEGCDLESGIMEEGSDLESEMDSEEKKPPARGICLIFNNEYFETLSRRRGTKVDKVNLLRTFRRLQFKIIEADNFTQVQMVKKLEEVASLDHNKFECFVCCILSHGGESVVFGSDEEQLSYELLTMPFKPNNCIGLAGKPKVFFIQSCHGGNAQQGIETDGVAATLIPDEEDFFIACSTFTDLNSYRSKSRGSWFIRNLCQVLALNATSLDLGAMMEMLNDTVKREIGEKNNLPCVRVSAPTTTLRKKLLSLEDPDSEIQ